MRNPLTLTRPFAAQGKGVEATWTQDTDTLSVAVTVDESTRGRDIDLKVHPSRMHLSIKGEMALEGDFGTERVTPDGSFFGMEGEGAQRTCVVTLEKKQMGHKSWKEFFQEEEIDMSVTDKARTACMTIGR